MDFSKELKRAIEHEISLHYQELGDEIDGVEEVVGDGLPNSVRPEWESLIQQYGFEAVCQEIKKRFV